MPNLVISNFQTGLETDREPFLINNDAFPVLENAFIYRGRVRRKIGGILMNRLQRHLTNQALGNADANGDFSGNIVTILSLETNSQIVPGSVTINVGATAFTEPNPPDGTLVGGGGGTINYATGAISVLGGVALGAVTITFDYYPVLPVMGLEDFDKINNDFPVLVAFDTSYSYQVNQGTEEFYDVTFYKSTGGPFTWEGEDYQQFFSASYYNALWAVNGNPGFHFKTIEAITLGNPTTIQITNHGLTTSDWVYLNEIIGVEQPVGTSLLNRKAFQVFSTPTANTFTVNVDSTAATAPTNPSGIAQYLTQTVEADADGIRWYDGDPSGASGLGWVNFAPPLSNALNPEYLIGARLVVPFKDRLLFFGVTTRTSTGSEVTRGNQMIYSQNGTPFYNALVPQGIPADGFDPAAWFINVPARGGRLGNGTDEDNVTAEANEDVLICGLETQKKKLLFTGDDVIPFLYQTIETGIGDQSTFSAISLDDFVISLGDFGILACDQNRSKRVDLLIPDEVFKVAKTDFGQQRSTAVRDYKNHLIFFAFVNKNKNDTCKFPTTSLIYNYEENNWASFNESYTHFGYFRKSGSYTWATLPFDTWAEWLVPWNFGGYGDRYPLILGGNQQGFVIKRIDTVQEGISHFVLSYAAGQIGSPNHCLEGGDFIQFESALGLTNFNGRIFQVDNIVDSNNFTLGDSGDITGTYLGLGVFRRVENFNITTKQFQGFWENGSQSIIGPQRYLISTTNTGEVTVNMFLSSDDDISISDPLVSPWLPFSNKILTGAEYAFQTGRDRVWHRFNNTFIGDVVQLNFTMSEEQMLSEEIQLQPFELHAIVIGLDEGPEL